MYFCSRMLLSQLICVF